MLEENNTKTNILLYLESKALDLFPILFFQFFEENYSFCLY